jgi:hypothetical protein
MNHELKACPRCGNKEVTLRDHYGSTMWDIVCDMCCWTDTFDEAERAVEAWNQSIVNVAISDLNKTQRA